MYYCNKTDRVFDTKQGFVNHLRHVYKTLEDAYINEYNILKVPVCEYCNKNNRSFVSFFKGYSNVCNDSKCIYKQTVKTNIQSGKDRVNDIDHNYKKFILSNITFYVNHKRSKSIVDPYYNENINNITLKAFVSQKLHKESIVDYVCKFCGDKYSNHILSDRWYSCSKKKCIGLYENGYGLSDIILTNERDINNFYQWLKFDRLLPVDVCKNTIREHITDRNFIDSILSIRLSNTDGVILWKCPETGWHIPISKKSSILKKFLIKNKIDAVSYYKKYLLDYVSVCEWCGEVIKIYYSLHDSPQKRFCSHECYSFSLVGVPLSYEQKKKQSNTMKDKIKCGEYIPNINNIWNGKVIEMNGMKYRSSWEVIFHHLNQDLEYESLSIPYYDTVKKTWRNYFVDFIDNKNNMLYEVKPKSMISNQNSLDKTRASIVWCKNNNYRYRFITEDWFKNNVTYCNISNLPKYITNKMEKFVNEEVKNKVNKMC